MATTPAAAGRERRAWSLPARFGFLALFAYVVLFVYPFPVDVLLGLAAPWLPADSAYAAAAARVQEALDVHDVVMDAAVRWTGKQLFGLEEVVILRPNGSGDATSDWLGALVKLVVALLAGAVAAAATRPVRGFPRLARALGILTRFYLLVTMFGYGFAKVIPTQFPYPPFQRLLMPYADSSPMGLAWRFFGYSPAYSVFMGTSEVLGGLLLAFRRTATLGALIVAAVMANVVMINFAFDVPVKLYSSHLLLMAVGLCLPDLRRVAAVLVANRAVGPRPLPPLLASRRVDLVATVLKIALVAALAWKDVADGLRYREQMTAARAKPPLHGVHDVESFVRDGEELRGDAVPGERWRQLVFDFERQAAVRMSDDRWETFAVKHDPGAARLELRRASMVRPPPAPPSNGSAEEPPPDGVLHYASPEPGLLSLKGRLDGYEVVIRARARDLNQYQLHGRGFHWINERPFHR